jgi:hypothetical protein
MDRPFGHENKVPDCWPDLFAALQTVGQTSSPRGRRPRRGSRFVPDYRTDLFAGWAKPDGVAGSVTGIRQWYRPFVGAFVGGPMD